MTGGADASGTGAVRARLPRLLLAAAVSAFSLAVLLHLLRPGGEPAGAELLRALRAVAWPWIAGYVATQVLQVGLRAWRYALLLRAAGAANAPPGGHLALVTMARNMFVDLLPSRSGELVFVGLLNRVYRVAAEACLAALALSFVFDLLGLGAILLGLVALDLAHGSWSAGTAAGAAAVLGGGAAALALLLRGAGRVRAWAGRGGEPGRLRRATARLAGAVEAAGGAGVLAPVLGLTAGIRVAKYAGLVCVFLAVTVNSFPALAAASTRQVVTAFIGSEAAASLPLPTLMGFGAYEVGGAAAWALLGFDAAAAAVATLAAHVCSQAVDYSLGGVGLLLVTLLGGRAGAPAAAPAAGPARRRGRAVAGALAALALAAAALFAAREWRGYRRQGAFSPPEAGEPLAGEPGVAARLRPLLEGRTGFVVWSSNRSGSHDLWRMDLPGGGLTRLTRDPRVENHARISPDGRRVVFVRSRAPWVSLRDLADWDAWVLDLATGRETRIAQFAYRPAWDGDGAVVFQRRGTQVVRLDLATGGETVLARDGREGVPRGAILGDPSPEPGGGRLAVTVRGPRRLTALLGQGRLRKVGGGCQLAWAADGDSLVMVDDGGRMTNAIYRVDARTLRRTLLLDAPEPFSHEYFPALSRDGAFLVFGASAGGHEHDTEDYEVFLWRVGDPADGVVRLTWHTGNDSWPDIHLD